MSDLYDIDCYYTPGSPPCRLVLLTAAALDVPLHCIELDLNKDEQMSEKFLKLNPQHILPTIVDRDFVLWESRAIARYLINKYEPGDDLYPEDTKIRGKIDQILDFDLGLLSPSFAQYFYPHLFKKEVNGPERYKKLCDNLTFLDKFLETDEFVAGDKLTLADLALVVTVSTIEAVGIKLKPYPNIMSWYKRVKAVIPGYKKINEEGLNEYKKLVAQVRRMHSSKDSLASTVSRHSSDSSAGVEESDHNNEEDSVQHTVPLNTSRNAAKIIDSILYLNQ